MKRAVSLCVLVLLMSGCSGGNRGPDRTVRRFFRAMNEKDVNQLLSCVDPKQERLLRATFRLVEKTIGLPVEGLLKMLPGLHQAFGEHMPEDFRFTNVRVQSRYLSGNTARLTVSVKSSCRSGGPVTTRLEHFELTLEEFEEEGRGIVAVGMVQRGTEGINHGHSDRAVAGDPQNS